MICFFFLLKCFPKKKNQPSLLVLDDYLRRWVPEQLKVRFLFPRQQMMEGKFLNFFRTTNGVKWKRIII